MKLISLFNHKGGVSKTTTAFNLGWMLAEKGKKILLVDADPQCNLTALVLDYNDVKDIEDFYSDFIECKHYAESNKVGVDVVRALHGVKNTKDGPNKIIVATTSAFTTDAINFAESEASSIWDITLADYNQIMNWIGDYGRI